MCSSSSLSAVGPNRTKLVTPNSSLKFTPEELVLYCRDMRVICFLFDRLTPDTQVLEVRVHVPMSPRFRSVRMIPLAVLMLKISPQMTYTIAKTYQPPKPGSVLSFQNAALGSVGERHSPSSWKMTWKVVRSRENSSPGRSLVSFERQNNRTHGKYWKCRV